MSYCRIGEGSDVYVYADGGGITCVGCSLEQASLTLPDAMEMLDHLITHRRYGEQVPDHAIDRLAAEAAGFAFPTDVELALEEYREKKERDNLPPV